MFLEKITLAGNSILFYFLPLLRKRKNTPAQIPAPIAILIIEFVKLSFLVSLFSFQLFWFNFSRYGFGSIPKDSNIFFPSSIFCSTPIPER